MESVLFVFYFRLFLFIGFRVSKVERFYRKWFILFILCEIGFFSLFYRWGKWEFLCLKGWKGTV